MILLALGEKLLGPFISKFLPELLVAAALGLGFWAWHHRGAEITALRSRAAEQTATIATQQGTIADQSAQITRDDAAMASFSASIRGNDRRAAAIEQRISASPPTANAPDAPVLAGALDALSGGAK